MIRFSIIVPTLGRRSLAWLLDSIASQPLREDDEVLVVGECPNLALADQVRFFGRQFYYLYYPSPQAHCYGNAQRNFALPLCRNEYINYQDDDDVMGRRILLTMRSDCYLSPGKIFIYQMRWADGRLNPGFPPTQLAGGQCFVWPNVPGRMGTFGNRYTGDQDFMEQTISLHPQGKDGVIYRPEIITEYSGCHEQA